MVFIEVGSNDYLEPLAEQPPRKLTSDLMGLLRRDLSGRKGLNKVISGSMMNCDLWPISSCGSLSMGR